LRHIQEKLAATALAAIAAVCVVRCGGGSSPVAATVTPTPAPTAVPTPTPIVLTPIGPAGFVCPLGKGSGVIGAPGQCIQTRQADPTLFHAVYEAVLAVEGANPTWFYQDGSIVRLRNENRYDAFKEVVANLDSMGFCAIDDAHGPGDGLEIGVKRTYSYDPQDFSEQYKFWVTGTNGHGDGSIRLDSTMHVATCTPSWF
jgi:hypothetical protein